MRLFFVSFDQAFPYTHLSISCRWRCECLRCFQLKVRIFVLQEMIPELQHQPVRYICTIHLLKLIHGFNKHQLLGKKCFFCLTDQSKIFNRFVVRAERNLQSEDRSALDLTIPLSLSLSLSLCLSRLSAYARKEKTS